LKILHLATTDGGGAGRAAYRLHAALRAAGVDSSMLVRRKAHDDETVHAWWPRRARLRKAIGRRLEAAACRLGGAEEAIWSLGLTASGVAGEVNRLAPDLVHLHWVYDGFLGVREVARIRAPIVWSFHDLTALTEGYAYLGSMLEAHARDGFPDKVAGYSRSRVGRWSAARKRRAWGGLGIEVVAPSQWMARAARTSEVFAGSEVHHVPYGIDTDGFRPRDRRAARRELGLPEEVPLVLFGAARADGDRRKGGDLFFAAVERLAAGTREVELATFGGRERRVEELHGLRCHHLGHIDEEARLATCYAAADCFVAPSREDNLPNTVIEALACGSAVAAFRIGGMPDMVIEGTTGALAEPFEPASLAAAIRRCLAAAERLGKGARAHAEHAYAAERQAGEMVAIYRRRLGLDEAEKRQPATTRA